MADNLTLKNIGYDPYFQRLSYGEQLEVRANMARKELSSMPDFMKLADPVKMKIMEDLVFAPPSMVNKKVEALIARIGQNVKSGDRSPIPELGPLKVSAFGEIDNAMANRASADFTLIGGLYKNIMDKYQMKKPVETRLGQPSFFSSLPERFPEEADKILDYYDSLMDQEKQRLRFAKLLRSAMPLVATAMETIPLYMMGAGTYKVPKGLGKLFMAPFEKAMELAATPGARLLARVGGQAAHGVATAALWTGREIALDILNEKLPKDPGLQYWLKYGAKRFGEAYLFDFAFNMIEGIVWPMVKGTGKVFGKGVSFKNLWENLEAEQTSRLISGILSGGYADPALVNKLPLKVQRVVKSVYNARRVFENVKKLDPDQLLQAMGLVSGWNVTLKKEGGYLLEQVMGEGVENFDDILKAQKFINEAAMELKGPVERTVRDSILSGAAYDKVRLRKIISGKLSDQAFENTDILTRLVAPTGGKWTKGKIRAFGKASLRAIGADEDTIAKFAVREWEPNIVAMIDKDEIAVFPKVVKGVKEETEAISAFLDAIKPYKAGNVNIAEDLVKDYLPSLKRQHLFTPGWVEDQVKTTLKGDLEKTARGIVVHLPEATPLTFDTMDEVGKYIISETIDPDYFKSYLKRKFGLSLHVEKETGKAEVYASGKKVVEAENFRSLVRENPAFLDKIPSSLGPDLTLTTDGTLRVRYVKGVLTGSYDNILRELSQFENYKPVSQFVQIESSKKGSIQVHKVTKEISVELPDIGYRSPARTIKEARHLLLTGAADWGNLEFISHSKGYRVVPFGEGYAFYSTAGDGKVTFTRTLAETESFLKNVNEIPSWAPELSGLDELDVASNKLLMEKYGGGVSIPENMFKPTEFTTPLRTEKLPWNVVMGQFYRPPEPWLVRAVAEGGDPKLLEYFRQIEATRQFVKAQEGLTGDAIHKIFLQRTPEGKLGKKMMNRKERLEVGSYLLQKRANPTIAGKLYQKLSDWQKDVARQVHELGFGGTPEEGLALKFQLSQTNWLEDYAPKIRKYYLKNSKKSFSEGKAYRYLREVFDGKTPPQELDAFFRHARTSDVINMALEDDPLTMLLRYSAVGHRQHYLGPIYSEANKYIRKMKNLSGAQGQMAKRMSVYMGQIMGMPEGLGEEIVHDTLQGIFNKLGLKGKLGGDIVSKIISLQYLSFMGFRPWLPIRNSFQIWTTLAPRVGNDWVAQGLREVANDSDGMIYQFLRNRGVMTGSLPLFGAEEIMGSASGKAGRFVQNLTHKGLQWYKNSDDFTRAVAWRASYGRFMDSVERLNKGIWKNLDPDMATKRFMEMSGAVQLHPDLKEKVKFWLRNGQVQEAATTFADWMTEQTLFSYRKGMSPIWAKGIVGKLFGMFGTYPAYYVENIRTALKYMPRGAKLAYMGRFLGNSFLLYEAFKNAFGVNANNFLPWVPGSFSGGPMYDLMNKALKSMDIKSYAGRQARAELMGLTTKDGKPSWKFMQSDIGRTLTGYQLRSVIDAVEAFDDGDLYGGFLSLGSFPKNPDWFED
jgi:hypothetical protein